VDKITVVSWNTALGAADVIAMVRALPHDTPLVMLLQEVYRGGPEVPRTLGRDATYAGHLAGACARPGAHEVEAVAAELGLSVYYVPSMRNGGPSASDEDRGNAILSNLSLSDLAAIELPFEHQRRVAISAIVAGITSAGVPWRIRVVSAHLDNIASPRYGWIGGEYGRARQARGLVALLRDDVPTVLGGDFNTWFGFSEPAYVETAAAFPQTRMPDRRATFRGLLRLDHVFLRLSPDWAAEFRRGDDRFGSDHYPLVGTLRFR
jgi:endonuclease/exonuclease/phosphatase family metal-dependent hydrolase